MTFECKRCGHKWHPRNKEKTPRLCPRCKSTQWEKEKIRSWEEIGKLYVVLYKEGIKIGRATIPTRRISNFANKQKYFYSYNCKNIKKHEKLFKEQTIKICGKAIKGYEYFRGGEQEYNKIVLYLKTVGDKSLAGEQTYNKDIADYDFNELIKNLYAETFYKIVLQERKNCLAAICEAIDDAQNKKCSYRKALFSLNSTLTNLVTITIDQLANINKELI